MVRRYWSWEEGRRDRERGVDVHFSMYMYMNSYDVVFFAARSIVGYLHQYDHTVLTVTLRA